MSMTTRVMALGVVMLTGCRHEVAPTVSRTAGVGRYEFVAPPPAADDGKLQLATKELLTKDEFVPPRALGVLEEPGYPAAALAARVGPVSLGLRLVVDETGKVSDISSSGLIFSLPAPLEGEFRAAIETAVRQWRFRPAEVRHFTTVTNNAGTYRSLAGTETTEWALHVMFRFDAVSPAPVEVRASAATARGK
jgi:hypothetical protein